MGTPEQDVRVLISTASQQTWVILEKGCLPGAKVCSDARGGIFYPENSTTWSLHGAGYYELSLEQNLLNISANGLYGSDTLGLSLQRSDGPTLENQVIGGIAAEEFYLGIFGLNPRPTIFSVNESGQASYITSLREQNMVPSTSFGYTAGAPYRKSCILYRILFTHLML